MRRPARRGPLLAWGGALALFGLAGPAAAQDGPYVRMGLGVAAAAGMTLEGTDNDWSTKCDLIINPAMAEVTDECDVPPPPTGWSNRFGGGSGIRSGIAFGYRRGRVRIEGEYFQRVAVFDERSDATILDAVTLGKQDQEIEVAAGSLDDLRSHAFFANLYYDFAPAGSTWTPFAGFGAGVERAALHYFTEWKRNADPGLITTFVDPLLRAKVAGTATIGEASLTDRVVGWQVLAGLDRRLAERVTLGVEFRWAAFGAFTSDPLEWNQLRGHDSTVGRGERIVYTVSTADNRFRGLTLGLRYGF